MNRRAMHLRAGIAASVAFLLAVGVLAVGARVARGATDIVTSTTTPSTDPSPTPTTTDPAPTSTTITDEIDEIDDGTKRVVVVGDSLVVGAQGQLVELFEANGVEHRFIAVSGTGLLTDQGVRLTELTAAVEELHPDVVVIESCCNYDGGYVLPDGTLVTADSDLLWEVWAQQLEAMIAVAEAHDAEVQLVITPRLTGDAASSSVALRIERFNEIYRSTGEALVDWDATLYPGGITEGHESVRAADGLHLSTEGNELVAAATWSAIAGSFS